jgi:hypothetical protein
VTKIWSTRRIPLLWKWDNVIHRQLVLPEMSRTAPSVYESNFTNRVNECLHFLNCKLAVTFIELHM